MSMIDLQVAKKHLRVLHNSDDALIQLYLDGAEAEAADFMDRAQLPLAAAAECCSASEVASETSSDGVIVPAVVSAVLLLLETAYYSKSLSPYETQLRRQRAEQLCMPHRCRLGV